MNIERKGKRKGEQKTEEMGNSLNYREIHLLTHKLNKLNWKIGPYKSLIFWNFPHVLGFFDHLIWVLVLLAHMIKKKNLCSFCCKLPEISEIPKHFKFVWFYMMLWTKNKKKQKSENMPN